MSPRPNALTVSSRLLWIVAANTIGWMAVVASGADYPWELYVGRFPDLAPDKHMALPVVEGSGPYTTLAELSDHYGSAEAVYSPNRGR